MKYINILFALLLNLLITNPLLADPPTWSVNPSDYQYNMIGMIRVVTLNNTFLNDDGTIIRAIVDGETRGVVDSLDIIFVNGDAYMPITMYSNQQVGEVLNFEVYSANQDSVYTASETAIFNRNENLGTPISPFILTIDICESILILSSEDIPFRSFYKAGTEIHIQGPILNLSDTLLLNAPLVKVLGNCQLDSEVLLTVQKNGCFIE